MLTRRNLLFGLPAALVVAGLAHAQQAPKVIGFLSAYSSREADRARPVFVKAMLDLGYSQGRDYVMVDRYAEGRNGRLPELAADLLRQRVDLILTSSTDAAKAAAQATSTIPIVFEGVADPVLAGLADSLGRPGHNATGLANFNIDSNAKGLSC